MLRSLLGDAVFTAGTLRVKRRLGPAHAGSNTVAAPDGVALTAWWGSSGIAPLFVREGYSPLLPDSRALGGRYVKDGLLERYDVIAWAKWMRTAGCAFTSIVAECPYADLCEIADYRIRKIAGPLTPWIIGSGLVYAKWVNGLADDQTPPSEFGAAWRRQIRGRNAGWFRRPRIPARRTQPPEEFRKRVLHWFSSSRPAAGDPAWTR